METGTAHFPNVAGGTVWVGETRPDTLGQCPRCFSRVSPRGSGVCKNCRVELRGKPAPNNPPPATKQYQPAEELDEHINLIYGKAETWPVLEPLVRVMNPFTRQTPVPTEALMPASHNRRMEDERIISSILRR